MGMQLMLGPFFSRVGSSPPEGRRTDRRKPGPEPNWTGALQRQCFRFKIFCEVSYKPRIELVVVLDYCYFHMSGLSISVERAKRLESTGHPLKKNSRKLTRSEI